MDSQPLNPAQNTNEETPSKLEKVTFTPEQQQRIDAIVRDSMGRAASEVRMNLAKALAEKEQLEKDLAAAKAANTDFDLVEKLHNESRQKDKELADYRKLVTDQRLDSEVLKASQGKGFVDLEVVRELTKGFVKINQANQITILDEQGNERLNADHKPMTLSDFYSDYAKTHPFLVKSDVKGGSGSSQSTQYRSDSNIPLTSIFGKGSDARLANNIAQADPVRYRALRQKAKEAGLVA